MNVFELFAKINLDSSDYENGLGKAEEDTNKFADKLKSGLKTAGKVTMAGVGVAVTGISAMTKSAVSNFADYEQLVGGVETLFKGSAGKVQEYADRAFQTAGLSANEYMETVTGFSASLLQSLGGDTEKSADIADMAIIDMADNANKMGSSMESIQNAYQGFAKQNYTMLDNLKLGYGGTKSEMERLIADANELRKAQGLNADLTIESYADVITAIHEVQENMDISGTTAKEAGETISGSIASMKAQWDNLVTALANGKKVDMTSVVTNFTKTAKTAIGNIIPIVKQSIEGIGSLINELVPVILQEIPPLLNDILPDLMATAMSLIETIGNTIMENLPMLLDTAMQIVLQLATGLGEALPYLVPAIVNAILLIAETLVSNIDVIIDAGFKIILGLAQGLLNALPDLIGRIPEIIIRLVTALGDATPKFLEFGIDLIANVGMGIIEGLPKLLGAIPNVVSAVMNAFKTGFQAIKEVGTNLIKGLWEGIKGAWGWMKEKVKGWAGNVVSSVKGFFGIHSPSKVFAQIGEYCVEGFNQPMDEMMDTDSMISNLQNGINAVEGAVSDVNITGTSVIGSGDQNVSVNITLAGDADGIFKIVKQEATKYNKSTGKMAFA